MFFLSFFGIHPFYVFEQFGMNAILLFFCFFILFPSFQRKSMNFERFKLYYVSLYHLFAAFPLHFSSFLGASCRHNIKTTGIAPRYAVQSLPYYNHRCSRIIIAHTITSRMQEPQIACTPIRKDSTPPSPAPIAKMKMIP